MNITFNEYDNHRALSAVRAALDHLMETSGEPAVLVDQVNKAVDVPPSIYRVPAGDLTTADLTAEANIPPPPPAVPVGSENPSTVPPPPPAAPADAPAPPAAPADAPAAGPLDAAGFPWDARIHATTKTKTTKGVWKLLRGVDKALVAQIQSAAATPVLETPAAPPPPPQTAPPPADAVPWPDVVEKVMGAKLQEQISQEQIDAKMVEYGVTGGFMSFHKHPDLFARLLIELGL